MGMYRKKPVVIEAIQWIGQDISDVLEFSDDIVWMSLHPSKLSIKTPEGEMKASMGDWIIKGVNGEVYPCKDDIFQKTYDVVLD